MEDGYRAADLDALMLRAKGDPAFEEVGRKVKESGILTWLEPDEKALLYGIGSFAGGEGVLVEIGAFEGGSASFLAAGLARRGAGRLHSIDPHLGAPPWFGLAPHKRTLGAFRRCVNHCGLDGWVQSHLGDSASVAAIWPGQRVDAVLIDGDHSYLGALADFECWGPKVRPGGLILFDDVNGSLVELNELIAELKGLRSVESLGMVGEVAVFRRLDTEPWDMMAELSGLLAARRVHRPWDMSCLHATDLPPNFRRDAEWPSVELGEAYMVGFFARCGAGDYGYTGKVPAEDRAMLEAICHDRRDGKVVKVDGLAERLRSGAGRRPGGFRIILCHPSEAHALAPRLLDGGVLFARDHRPQNRAILIENRNVLLGAGLSGVGGTASLYWCVWRPDHLSAGAMLHFALGSAGLTRTAG